MNYRQLGMNGPKISEVSLGCWQLGGDFGALGEQQGFAILQKAVDSGVNFFDTADVYGSGRSEKIIGDFLKSTTENVYIGSKYGRSDDVYPDKYSESSMRRIVEGSLSRLNIPALDVLQLHCVPLSVLQQGDIFEWLKKLKTEGLIKAYGASVETVEEAKCCLQHDGLQSLQVIFNLFRQDLVEDLFSLVQQKNVGLLARLPLASGLLSGKFTSATRFSENDHRHYNRDGQCFSVGETFSGLPYEKGLEIMDALRAYVPEGFSMAELALRWLLDHEAVTAIIPGASSPQQVVSNVRASELPPLPEVLMKALKVFYEQSVRDWVRGPY